MKEAKYIWHNGEMKPWHEATVHVLAHGLHYGSAVFEGIRCYDTPRGAAIFRLEDHMRRLFMSGRVYRINIKYSLEELLDACRRTITDNGLFGGAYLRPIAYRGYGEVGVSAVNNPIDVAIASFPWGRYLGEEGIDQGIDVCISSWNRVAPNTIPAGIKAAGNYLSSQLVSLEAKERGFAEGIALGPDGLLSEGAGENLFVVKDGVIMTPPQAASILAGITRDTVIKLAKRMGYDVREQVLSREMLYLVDEAFLTGTAAEVTPIRSVDRLTIGDGNRPVTKAIQDAFFGLFSGKTEPEEGWLDYVETPEQAAKRKAA